MDPEIQERFGTDFGCAISAVREHITAKFEESRAQIRLELLLQIAESLKTVRTSAFVRVYPAIALASDYTITQDWPLEVLASAVANANRTGKTNMATVGKNLSAILEGSWRPEVTEKGDMGDRNISPRLLAFGREILQSMGAIGPWMMSIRGNVVRFTVDDVPGCTEWKDEKEVMAYVQETKTWILADEALEHRLHRACELLLEANALENEARKKADALRREAHDLINAQD